MAFINLVRFDGLKSRDWLIYKYPSEDLVLGTQLIVQEGQAAIFVKSGLVADVFYPGTYTLATENLPLLKGLINLPFGGRTPFSAEIYFVNTTVRLDIHWGTNDPIQLIDPKYYVKLRIRAFGQMGLRVLDAVRLFKELIGGMQQADIVKFDKIKEYYRGLLVIKAKSAIAETIINNGISALEISAKLEEISLKVENQIAPEFEKYGLKIGGDQYPKKITSPSGEPVYVAEAWNYSYLIGELKAKFDKKGVITGLVASPKLLLGDDLFEVKNAEGKKVQASKEEKAAILAAIKKDKNLKIVKNDETLQKLLDRYQKEKTELGKKSVGKIKEMIPGGSENRIPSAKNPEGSLATTLVMEAELDTLRNTGTGNVDFVLGNAGNVRITIEPGDFTYDEAYTLLPFTTNTVYTLEVTGAEMKQILEDAIDYALTGGSTGSFPYGAGIRYEATKDGKLGTRVTKVEVFDFKANKWVPIDANKKYMLATNSYIAGGKDGYTTLGKITSERGGTNTYLGDDKIFIDYLQKHKELGRPASSNVKFKY